MGTIAGIAAIAAFIAALIMLTLSGLGLAHARRVSPSADILTRHPDRARHPGPVTDSALNLNGNGLAAAVPGNSAAPPA
jgi:hypothetical protein